MLTMEIRRSADVDVETVPGENGKLSPSEQAAPANRIIIRKSRRQSLPVREPNSSSLGRIYPSVIIAYLLHLVHV